MSTEQRLLEFAGRIGYKSDGISKYITFVHLLTGNSYDRSESRVPGVSLGQFYNAKLTRNKILEDFELTNKSFQVKVVDQFAHILDIEAQLILDINGQKIFQTKSFGDVFPSNQSLRVGKYLIWIRVATISEKKSYKTNLPFLGDAQEKLDLPSAPLSLNLAPKKIESGRQSSEYFKQELAQLKITFRPISTVPPGTVPQHFVPYNSPSNEPVQRTEPRAPPAQPISPKTQKVPVSHVTGIPRPRPPSSVGGETRVMRAFVENVVPQLNNNIRHYLWICDLTCRAIFVTNQFDLSKGHFFEGVFVQDKKQEWRCVKYLKEIPALLEGSLNQGRIELISKVISYQEKGEKRPHIVAEFLGKIDNRSILPSDCQGMKVTIMRKKCAGEFQWVVCGLA